jgi:hypothetical protein
MYGDQLRYHLLVALIIMFLLLMMQLEKLGFIAFDKNLMFLILLRNGNIWLRMKQEKRLKCLRSKNGGEYCSKDFDDYCSYHEICREKTVPGTPQENGASERMNRTFMECARSMRLHVTFPLKFWEDVVDIVVYLINRGPSRSLDGGIREGAWIVKNVNYSFFKTFNHEAFVHIDKENKTKLDAKYKKCTFIGYSVNNFGYLLWDYENHKIISSRHVIFNEKVMYKD